MHDIRSIRDNPDMFDRQLERRALAPAAQEILAMDSARREKITAAESAQAEANRAAKAVGQAKANGDEAEFERLRAVIAEQKSAINDLEAAAKQADARLQELLMGLPNAAMKDVPDGVDEDDNLEIKRFKVAQNFSFAPKEHFEIASVASTMDFEIAARLSGSRFVVLSGALARIHRALAQFMIDTHITENGLMEINAPVLVRDQAMMNTGQLPKFAEDSYQTTNGWWLIPTSEVTLTNLVADQIVPQSALPKRFTAHSLCFRSEAGSAGRDTTGMLRQHQFEKVEMVSITHPDESRTELDRMSQCAEGILERLELPYRTLILCAGDMGFGAQLTYDIEVWLPGQNKYREISSCSLCGDFQARRMGARFRPENGGKPDYVHTLNGSGLAVGRTLIAVLENGQTEDGSVNLPKALAPYLGGQLLLDARGVLRKGCG